MPTPTSLEETFRFSHLRPRRPIAESGAIALEAGSQLLRPLRSAHEVTTRSAVAEKWLAASPISSLQDVPHGTEIAKAVKQLRQVPLATTDDLHAAVPQFEATRATRQFTQAVVQLANFLVAGTLAARGIPGDLSDLAVVYRVYRMPPAGNPHHLAKTVTARLILPDLPALTPAATPASTPSTRPPNQPTRAADPGFDAAIEELIRHDRPQDLVMPSARGGSPTMTLFALLPSVRNSLSTQTTALLRTHGVSLARLSLADAAAVLHGFAISQPVPFTWPTPHVDPLPGVTLPPAPETALVRPAGVADLLVVKQHIRGYEGGEVAHVENVMDGEKRTRAHRALDRSEETTLFETENTRSRETELETADRFELNREASRTIEADQKRGLGLTLSGKYGPSVEFSASYTTESSTSTDETAKSATTFAKDVTQRSLDRLTERVREMRSRTVVRETEETNLHEITGTGGAHKSGIYQFLDKLYEAQVFNYGIRALFDFTIPEPASFLWHVAGNPIIDIDVPDPPPKLEDVCPDERSVSTYNAPALAATYGVEIEPAPPPYLTVTGGIEHGEDDGTEEGYPRSNQRLDLTIPVGYRPVRAHVRALAVTDHEPVVAVVIGEQRALWQPPKAQRIAVSHDSSIAHLGTLFMDLSSFSHDLADPKLGATILAYETNTYSVDITVETLRSDVAMQKWRIATYNKIRAAYEDRLREHDQTVSRMREEAQARAERESRLPYGAPPAANLQTIKTELKKHCLAVVTQQRFDAFDATRDGAPPYFDFAEAAAEGAYIRFFEQAFEWDQMQYVCYPYFWARKPTWIQRFTFVDMDPTFEEFLRAGSARVVVPVRPGFEEALAHFMATGKLWGGEGPPPGIDSPLYVSIIDEIQERTGAPQGEIPVGEPWDVRVPTALVLLRPRSDLPAWAKIGAVAWDWAPTN